MCCEPHRVPRPQETPSVSVLKVLLKDSHVPGQKEPVSFPSASPGTGSVHHVLSVCPNTQLHQVSPHRALPPSLPPLASLSHSRIKFQLSFKVRASSPRL